MKTEQETVENSVFGFNFLALTKYNAEPQELARSRFYYSSLVTRKQG